MDLEERKTKARELFASYLKAKGGRKTPERMTVLDTLVEHRNLCIDELEQILVERHFRVSHATLYNTMRDLQEARLVRKQQIGKAAHFQYCDSRTTGFNMVCSRCGQIIEFQNAELDQLLKAYRPRRFAVQEYAVTLRGMCSRCQALLRKQEKRNRKKKIEQ